MDDKAAIRAANRRVEPRRACVSRRAVTWPRKRSSDLSTRGDNARSATRKKKLISRFIFEKTRSVYLTRNHSLFAAHSNLERYTRSNLERHSRSRYSHYIPAIRRHSRYRLDFKYHFRVITIVINSCGGGAFIVIVSSMKLLYFYVKKKKKRRIM